jgi:phosphoserine aminotransferase
VGGRPDDPLRPADILRDVPETPAVTIPAVSIPAELLPTDGRFGSGPSKVRPEAVQALAAVGRTLLGTSHRQAPVGARVGRGGGGVAERPRLPPAL